MTLIEALHTQTRSGVANLCPGTRRRLLADDSGLLQRPRQSPFGVEPLRGFVSPLLSARVIAIARSSRGPKPTHPTRRRESPLLRTWRHSAQDSEHRHVI